MDYSLKLNTLRAREARRAVLFNESWMRMLMWLLAVSFLFLGGWIASEYSSPFWYVFVSPLILWTMVWAYWVLHLKELPVIKKPSSVSDLLEQDLLQNLHPSGDKLTLKEFCEALDKTFGGRFLSTRFALSNTAIYSMLEALVEPTLGKALS
jgi:hypothetical protein